MSRLRHRRHGGKRAAEQVAPERKQGGGLSRAAPLRGEGEAATERHDRKSRASGGTAKFRTPSGGVSSHGRSEAARHGQTMPGGRFPIRNRQDLKNAKHDVGRAKGDKSAVRAWINKRARELRAPPLGG